MANVEIRLLAADGENFQSRAVSGGTVKTKQGVTLVGKVFHTSCITPEDLDDLHQALDADVDFIALSYVHHPEDMNELRALVNAKRPGVRLCAKIETRDAVRDIDEIAKGSDVLDGGPRRLGASDGYRGRAAGSEADHCAAQRAGKPVITATQMLESMTHAPRPTRAEATDVAKADSRRHGRGHALGRDGGG